MTTPTEPVDVLDRERRNAAHRNLRDAEAYLDRITQQYGPNHDETRYAEQLADEARAHHQCSNNCTLYFIGYTVDADGSRAPLIEAVPHG